MLAFFLPLLFLLGCGSLNPPEKAPFRIAIDPWPGYAYVVIAEEKGFFDKNGVDVELIYTADLSEAVNLYETGAVDAFFWVYSDVILEKTKGFDGKVVFVADYSAGADGIVAQPEIKSVVELRGKTLSCDGINSYSHLFLLRILEKYGIREGDFFLKDIPVTGVADALEKGQIDAGHTYEPFKTRTVNKGFNQIASASDVPGLMSDVLLVHSSAVSDRSHDVRAVIKSMLEARKYAAVNPGECLPIMALKESSSVEEMRNGINGVYQLDLNDNVRSFSDSDDYLSLYRNGREIEKFYSNRGMLSDEPAFAEFLEPGFVLSLNKGIS